jgi:hypothetical protein
MGREAWEALGASIDQINYAMICKETWGHLAPKKNVSYKGFIRFAVGVFGDDDLNPVPIACELRSTKEELDSSPWFYDALTDLLSEWASAGRYGNDPLPVPIEGGNVYEWRGTFRNYEFRGTIRKMTLV